MRLPAWKTAAMEGDVIAVVHRLIPAKAVAASLDAIAFNRRRDLLTLRLAERRCGNDLTSVDPAFVDVRLQPSREIGGRRDDATGGVHHLIVLDEPQQLNLSLSIDLVR